MDSRTEELNKCAEVAGTQGLTLEEGTSENWGKARKNTMAINWNRHKFLISTTYVCYLNACIMHLCTHTCICIRRYASLYIHTCFLFVQRV